MPEAHPDGLRISYDDSGRGEPALLFMPGWCGSRAVFEQLASRCSTHRRTLGLDWRGHGQSGSSQDDFGSDGLVEDALAVIEASGAERIVPAALAHAGWVAIELRRRLAERVRGSCFSTGSSRRRHRLPRSAAGAARPRAVGTDTRRTLLDVVARAERPRVDPVRSRGHGLLRLRDVGAGWLRDTVCLYPGGQPTPGAFRAGSSGTSAAPVRSARGSGVPGGPADVRRGASLVQRAQAGSEKPLPDARGTGRDGDGHRRLYCFLSRSSYRYRSRLPEFSSAPVGLGSESPKDFSDGLSEVR